MSQYGEHLIHRSVNQWPDHRFKAFAGKGVIIIGKARFDHIFGGFLAGIVLGTILAAATSVSRWADLLLSPAIKVVRATPVASFIILVLLWVESGRVPGIMSALMVLPVVWGNVSAGIAKTDPLLLEAASFYRFGAGKKLRLLYIPSVLPYFFSGCSTALGLAWKSGVAAEVLCLPSLAVGTKLYYAKIYLETPSLFAWTAVVILLSYLLERAFLALCNLLRRNHKEASL
ncbi:MAG: ABC transporter permease subunit [Clostridia bacterium]|nr:ABC transporter permease subunit [Clostridia bacterium]